MKDTIIKGAGNSRTIKSVPNAPTLYPSYDAFIQALATSGLPIDLLGLNAAGINQAGTDLNKANMLPDAVEQAIWGSAADRNVGQALQQLRSLITTAQTTANGKAKFETGTYIGNGTSGAEHPTSVTLTFEPYLFIVASSLSQLAIPDYNKNSAYATLIAVNGVDVYKLTGNQMNVDLRISWGKTMQWYISGAEIYDLQLNGAGRMYRYIAIG